MNNIQKKNISSKHNITLAIISFLLGFFIFYIFNTYKQNNTESKDLTLFWDVWTLLEEKYPFEEPSNKDKIYGAISGLVDSYDDDYSSFFPPIESEFFNQTISGEFGGIGVEIGQRSGYLVVISPLKNSPGEKAGLLPGDIITHVDNVEIVGMTTDEAIGLIRGDKGTDVSLTIRRLDAQDPIIIVVTRDIVVVPVIDTEIIEDSFIISLYNFNELSEEPFKQALEEFIRSEKKQLLLDLRNNPGGYLTSAIDMASYFIDQGEIVVIEQFGLESQDEHIFRSDGYSLLDNYEFDMVVLVNQGSASASEILAGALRDYGIATIAGERTYGKGSVQELINLAQNTSLKITISQWLTPKRNQISEVGIQPDQVINDDLNSTEDTQLLNAIQLFNTE